MSVVRDFILIAVKVRQRIERSQKFQLNSSEVKQRSECSQRFHFDNIGVTQRRERSQRFYFSVTYAKEIVSPWLVLQQQ